MKLAHAVSLSLLALSPLASPASPASHAETPKPASTPMTAPSATTTRMIVNDGHKLAFHVTPGRLPAIVLDAGGGLDSSSWASLVPELARRTGAEIITYDRAGFGASDEVKGPWNVQAATDDLAAGLQALGATHGVILVAHSLAGEIATYLARRHPDWLAGAVLVDASVPEFYTDAVIAQVAAQYAPALQAARSEPSTKESRQLVALAESFAESSRAFHQASWPRTVPAIVIVSEKTPFDAPAAAQWWKDAHAQFAQAAPNRRLVMAHRSSHDVMHDRPDVILQAVAELAPKHR